MAMDGQGARSAGHQSAGRHLSTRGSFIPILTVLAVLIAAWYLAAIALNAPMARDAAARAGDRKSVV